MADIVLSTDDLTILGGPSSISVSVDLGAQGIRGTNIFSNQGKPTDPDVAAALPELIINDLYINLKPSDDEYLFLYQYQNVNGIPGWQRTLRLIPNTALLNTDITFVDGQAVTIQGGMPVPGVYFPLSMFFPTDQLGALTRDNFSIQYNLVTENSEETFAEAQLTGEFTLIQNPIIMSGMTVGPKTTISGLEYLPIFITAAELTELGPVPLGTALDPVVKKAHVFVTVV